MFQKNKNMGKAIIVQPHTTHYQELAQEHYKSLLQLGYSAKSSRARWRMLLEFLCYAETSITTDITAITTKDILNYDTYLQIRPSKKDGTNLSKRTICGHLHTIKTFYTMLQNKHTIQINPTNTIHIKYASITNERVALTQAEIKELYKHAITLKEKAILALGYGCGLRVGELVRCNINDVRLREQVVIVPKGKFNKSRTVPLSRNSVEDLTNYFYKERLQEKSKNTIAFILHVRGGRMQEWTYNKILQSIIERTKNDTIKSKQITIHHLRHSIATHLIEQGVPLERVKEFLGHSQLETTEIYTHISNYQLQKLVK